MKCVIMNELTGRSANLLFLITFTLSCVILLCMSSAVFAASGIEKGSNNTIESHALYGDIYGALAEGGGIYICTTEALDPFNDHMADREVFIVRLKVNRILVPGDGITATGRGVVSLPMVKFTGFMLDSGASVWPDKVIPGKKYLCVIVKNAIENTTTLRTADGALTDIYEIAGQDDKVVKTFEAIAAIHSEKDPIKLNGLVTQAVVSYDPLLSGYAIKKAARDMTAVDPDPLFWTRQSVGLVVQAIHNAEYNGNNQKAVNALCFMELEQLCTFREDSREKDAIIVSAIANEILSQNAVTNRPAIHTLASIIGSSTPEYGNGKSLLDARKILTADEIRVVLARIGTPTMAEDQTVVGWLETKNPPVSMEKMAQLHGDALETYIGQLSIDRSTLEQQLIQGLSTAKTTETKLSIVYLLGVYRMEHAVPILSSMMTLTDDRPLVRTRESVLGGYSVVEALVRIGSPAVPAMLNNIENSEDTTVRDLSVSVIKSVYGIELTRSYLQIALEKQKDTTIKGRLSQAIEKLPK